MNGAEAVARTLVAGGVTVCFANPGTSEMHFVAALDRTPDMRCALCLFEGVATGAADGYARMADRPAATLLHLGPGLANGLANLHNARRAGSPIVNVVGDHATYHRAYDAPLTSDVEGTAAPYSHWVRTSTGADAVARDTAVAVAEACAPPGRIATLILPADAAWNDAPDGPAAPLFVKPPARVPAERIVEIARLLRMGAGGALLLTGRALRAEGLALAGRIAVKTGVEILAQTSNNRIARGAGRVSIERVPYPVDEARTRLSGVRRLVLAGSKAPVAFFAYPNKPSVPTDPDCEIHVLAAPDEDLTQALADLAAELDAAAPPIAQGRELPARTQSGSITPKGLAATVCALLPENAIVVDEGVSVSHIFYGGLRGAAPHDWIHLTGGAIGDGLPMAVGAAVACPERKVVCLQADGSAMYTIQALWTMARESLDVTVVLLNNRAYETLKGEFAKVGANDMGVAARDMMSLDRPEIAWADLARSLGIEGRKAIDMEEFDRAFAGAMAQRGPCLIDAAF